MNLITWDFRIPGPVRVPGAVAWPPHPRGARVPPGTYTVELWRGDDRIGGHPFDVLGDPAVKTTPAEYADQYALLVEIQNRLSDAHRAVNAIRDMRSQMDAALAQVRRAGESGDAGDDGDGAGDELAAASKALRAELASIEDALIQTRSKSSQDPLNHPIRINDKIGALVYTVDGDFGPTQAARTVLSRLSDQLDVQLERLDVAQADLVPAFNRAVAEAAPPAIVVDGDDAGDM